MAPELRAHVGGSDLEVIKALYDASEIDPEQLALFHEIDKVTVEDLAKLIATAFPSS
jgi:hypothetical protein